MHFSLIQQATVNGKPYTNSDKGLCFYNASRDEHFSIVGLKAGDKFVVNVSSGQVLFTTSNCTGPYRPYSGSSHGDVTTGTPTLWGELQSGETYTVLKDGVVSLQAKKTWTVISSIVIVPSQTESVSAPTVSSEATEGGRNVTITSGTSNMLSGVKTYYTIDGSTPTALSAQYTGAFKITETTTIKAITISNSSAATASAVTEQLVNLDVVDNPVLSVTGTSDNSRVVTITCATDGATIYYSETEKNNAEDGWLTYSTPVTTAATTLYAYAEKNAQKTDVVSFATGAGTTINLLPATVTHSNNGVYTIASDQSAILGAPTATIHYQIDGASEQTSTNASVNVNIAADGTLTYWLTADGYGATAPADETVYAARAYAATTTLNFCTNSDAGSAAWAYGNVENYDMSTITVTTVNTDRTYYKYLDESGNIIGDGLLAVSAVNGGQSWRIDKNSAGVHPYNKTEYVVLLGMEAGQLIQIAANSAPSSISNLTVYPAATYTGTYTYSATADGEVIFSLAKDVQLKTIKLCAIPVTVTEAGFATYVNSDYDLDFSATSIEAYKVKVSSKGVATLKKVNNVPAGTPVLLYKDGGATENIPVMTGAAAVSDNDLVAGTGAAVATEDGEYTNMILNNIGGNVGFYFAAGQTVATNRAYLHFATSLAPDPAAARMTMIFEDDDVTSISEELRVKSEEFAPAADFYDLQGRKVAQPTKGLYIVNGKKVVLK